MNNLETGNKMLLVASLSKIQKELKAPKNQFNKFGKYNYRNSEDILEAVKPLLDGCIITLSDEIVSVGNRFYVKSTACFTDGDSCICSSANARETETKKGMDESQITGSASSYSRKYALNGLFAIDDNKDADSHENKNEANNSQPKNNDCPEIQAILKMIQENNIQAVHNNWKGMIAAYWPKLEPHIHEALNKMINTPPLQAVSKQG